jgi:hypothetical protein
MREPLWLASIGTGPQHVLVIAGAHANEPVGLHTALALAGCLAEDPELTDGQTWHLLPVWDPDGAALNQWHAGPLSPRSYYQGFYRPAVCDQPGFMFPRDGAGRGPSQPLPETWAVMRVIDQLSPELVIDLHNGDLGGRAWFILNQRREGLAARLRAAAARGGLAVAETGTEYVGWETDGAGVFIEPATDPYGWAVQQYGSTLSQYLADTALLVIPEVPLWRIAEPSPPREGAEEGLTRLADELDASARILADLLAQAGRDLKVRTPFEPAAVMHFDFCRELAVRARAWPGEATEADYASEASSLHLLRLRAAGLLRRTLAAEVAAGNLTAAIRDAAGRADSQFAEWIASLENTLAPRPIPIENLVRAQAGAALEAADHVRKATN